jgi:hypothetical protein
MSEMAAFLRMRDKLPLSVIQFPVGSWGFVGSVPVELRWVYDDLQDCRDAAAYGERLARLKAHREGRRFATRTWPTQSAAVADAKAAGYVVAGED